MQPKHKQHAASQIEACYTNLQLPTPLSALTGTESRFKLDTVTAQFSIPKAIIWQIQFIISGISSKKTIATATTELQQLSDKFGCDFDKYLLLELIDSIDLKDPNKPSKDKTEPVKCLLLI